MRRCDNAIGIYTHHRPGTSRSIVALSERAGAAGPSSQSNACTYLDMTSFDNVKRRQAQSSLVYTNAHSHSRTVLPRDAQVSAKRGTAM